MKSLIINLVAQLAILILSGEALGAGAERGLVLYDQPPATFVVALEFVTINTTSVAFVTVTLPDGTKQELPRSGIVAVIDYPPDVPAGSLAKDAATATQNIQALSSKYPQCAVKLNAALNKWTNALAFYQQKQKSASAGPSTPPTRGATLQIGGVKYTDATLTSFDGAFVGIEHSAGFARIPATALKPDQILALNATSSSVRIDSSKIVAPTSTPKAAIAGSSAVGRTAGNPSTSNGISQSAVEGNKTKEPQNQKIKDMYQHLDEENKKKFEAWLSMPIRTDEFIEPDNIASIEGPSYSETLEFINGKLTSFQSIGFGKATQKMIYRAAVTNQAGTATTFDPKNLNPEVRYDNTHVILQSRNKQTEFTKYSPELQKDGTMKISESKQESLSIYIGRDRLDAEKVAKAFSHLIVLLGGKAEAF